MVIGARDCRLRWTRVFFVHLVVPKEKTKYEKSSIVRRIDSGDSCCSHLVSASPAFAVKQFYDEFKEVYVNKGSLDASAVAKAKCNLCHEGKSKKDKNAYGELLGKLLDRKKDAKNPEKIRQALVAVESEKSPSGETYGDLLKEGKLP